MFFFLIYTDKLYFTPTKKYVSQIERAMYDNEKKLYHFKVKQKYFFFFTYKTFDYYKVICSKDRHNELKKLSQVKN